GTDGEVVFVEQPVAVPLVFGNGHAATVLIGTGNPQGDPPNATFNLDYGRPAYDPQTNVLFLPDPFFMRLAALRGGLPEASFPVFDFEVGAYGDNDPSADTLPGAS